MNWSVWLGNDRTIHCLWARVIVGRFIKSWLISWYCACVRLATALLRFDAYLTECRSECHGWCTRVQQRVASANERLRARVAATRAGFISVLRADVNCSRLISLQLVGISCRWHIAAGQWPLCCPFGIQFFFRFSSHLFQPSFFPPTSGLALSFSVCSEQCFVGPLVKRGALPSCK